MVTKKNSLIGYKFKIWFKENKDSIKNTITVISGLVAANYPNNIWIKILFGAGTGLISNWAISLIDYFFKE